MKVPIDQIKPSPYETRDTYGQEDFEELKQQARAGLLYPIMVREISEGYEIVDGHRRFAALKETGAVEAECQLYGKEDYRLAAIAVEMGKRDHSAIERGEMIWKWVENLFHMKKVHFPSQKLPKNPHAFIMVFRREGYWSDLNKELGDPIGQLTTRFGSLQSVENWLYAYRSASPELRKMESEGEITSSQAEEIARGLPPTKEKPERVALQRRVAEKVSRNKGLGGRLEIEEVLKVIREVEDDPELLEIAIETPYSSDWADEVRTYREVEGIKERRTKREEEEKERAWWAEHPTTKKFLENLKRDIRLMAWNMESVEKDKIPAEHCNYLATYIEEKVIPCYQDAANQLREKAKKWQ